MTGITEAILLGIAIGGVMGLTGAGGGILGVPALVLVLGWPPAAAAPVALIAVAIAAAIGTADGLRRGLVRYRAAMFMAACGMGLAPLGLKLATLAPERWLLLGFAAAMLLVAARTLRQAASRRGDVRAGQPACHVDPATGRLRWTARTFAALGLIGASSGLLTGLLGVGGGFLIVPALARFSDITMQGIVATSLAVIAIVSTGTVIAASFHAHAAPWMVAAPFAAGAALGMVAGRAGARHLEAAHLQSLFGGITTVVAIGMLVKAAAT